MNLCLDPRLRGDGPHAKAGRSAAGFTIEDYFFPLSASFSALPALNFGTTTGGI